MCNRLYGQARRRGYPISAGTHEPNDMQLLRLCDVHNIPVATNIATAEALIHALERGDLDWRDIVNPTR